MGRWARCPAGYLQYHPLPRVSTSAHSLGLGLVSVPTPHCETHHIPNAPFGRQRRPLPCASCCRYFPLRLSPAHLFELRQIQADMVCAEGKQIRCVPRVSASVSTSARARVWACRARAGTRVEGCEARARARARARAVDGWILMQT